MTDAIAIDGSTAVPAEATEGSIGVTTHATGKSYWFVSDGDNWIANGGAVAFTSFADIMGDPVDNTNITDYINELIPNGVRIATTTVQTNVGTKQALLAAVPTGKVRIVTSVVARNASASLGTYDGNIITGFDAGCNNFATSATGSVAALQDNTNQIYITPVDWSAPGPISGHTGIAGETFGCIFTDDSITATVDIDVHYYDVDA